MRRFYSLLMLMPVLAAGPQDYFTPTHRLAGIGVSREAITADVLSARTQLMIESQTFGIMRDPRALSGAERILSPRLKKYYDAAAQTSGLPASLIEAISYLESWGEADAQSPSGPKGIMQVSAATARSMGLQIVYATKYRTVMERKAVRKRRGRVSYRNVRTKVPFTVLVRDERLLPEKAIPAAAVYLAKMQARLGGLDWAVFAYHCGEGCVIGLQNLANNATGIEKPASVPKMFFGASPIFNRELYQALNREMERDYSPTYYFRIMRAQQLLALYQENRQSFYDLAREYRDDVDQIDRAPHRLASWLKPQDFVYRTPQDIHRDQGEKLVDAFDDPDYFGFTLRRNTGHSILDPANQGACFCASPSALGTLLYIAFETHRLHDAMRPKKEKFVPLEVTSLVQSGDVAAPLHRASYADRNEALAHSTGQVFDIHYADLPPGEREALRFVLDDIGWDGYLGFVEESPVNGTMHIGCSPSSRAFFNDVFHEAVELKHAS